MQLVKCVEKFRSNRTAFGFMATRQKIAKMAIFDSDLTFFSILYVYLLAIFKRNSCKIHIETISLILLNYQSYVFLCRKDHYRKLINKFVSFIFPRFTH